jgi:hypothetical protein
MEATSLRRLAMTIEEQAALLPNHRRDVHDGWWAAALAMLVLLTFWPVTRATFVLWDDPDLVQQNPDLNPVRLKNLGHYWVWPHLGLYSPLTYMAYGAIAGASRAMTEPGSPLVATPFHVVSLALHAGSVIGVWLILRALKVARFPAWLGAALFAVHPLQVEAVAWVASLNTVLSGCAGLFAISFYIRSAQSDPQTPERAIWRERNFLLSILFLLLALFAKPSAVVLPVIVVAIDVLLIRRAWRHVLIAGSIWGAITLPFVVVGRFSQMASIVEQTPLLQRPLLGVDAISFYLMKLAWPIRLSIDYGLTPTRMLATRWAHVAWIVPVILLIVAVMIRRSSPWLLCGLLIFIGAMLPVLGLVSFDFERYSVVADRYAYLGLLGVAVVVAYVTRTHAMRGIICVVLGMLVVLSNRQCRVWRDSDSLVAHTMALDPGSLAAHKILAAKLTAENRAADAIDHLRAALQRSPLDPDVRFNLANALLRQGQPQEAIEHYRQALVRRPTDAAIYNNMGIAMSRIGQLDDAVASFTRAVRLKPNYADAHANLAKALQLRQAPHSTTMP